jgi:muconate cycloisomerase
MKIRDVELFPVLTPRETGAISRHVILRLRSEEGAEGLGEFSDVTHTPFAMSPQLNRLKEALRGALVGQDPFQTTILTERVAGVCGGSGWTRLIASGVDTALHDLIGRSLGVPVYALLGGKRRDRVPMCYPIFNMSRPQDVGDNLERVAKVKALGYRRIRFYCGGNWDLDEAFLRGLRERFGKEVEVKSLDLSGGLYWKDAVRFLNRMRPYDYQMAESVSRGRDMEGMLEVRRRVDVPISEHIEDYRHGVAMIKAGAVDIFNISTAGLGVRGALALFELAHGAGLQTLHGTTQELSIGTAAAAHVCAAAPAVDLPCDPAGPQLYVEDVVKQRVRYENAELVVPEGPGLGVELDEAKLKELAGEV